MSIIRFEIRYADGRKEITSVEGERALIGNGAHCDVRLPLDQAAYEHVAVEVVGGTVRAESKAADPPATVNGMPFETIPMSPDVPLKIGSIRIFMSLAESAVDGPVAVKRKQEQTSPVMKVLGLAVLAGGAWMMMSDTDTGESPSPAQVPDLFVAKPTTCPQQAPDLAVSFAEEKSDLAASKRERSPFAPKDGVQAVNLYELASVCFKRGGKADRAAEADVAAQQLRAAISLDFRARRVRLEHFISVGDYEIAKNDVTVLRSLTEGKQGPYVTWLGEQNQIIKQRTATKK